MLSMMLEPLNRLRKSSAQWLRQGISPRRLALTLSVGFAIGCIPLMGVTTGLCLLVAFLFGLNLPAIQAANWLAMPLQLLLLVPFIRLGGRLPLVGGGAQPLSLQQLIHCSPIAFIEKMGGLAEQALAAWLLVAIPTVLLLTAILTLVFRRIPALTASTN